jgi:hypothetical protein
MERTQAVERLIAALAPAISAEVERTLEEAQQKLELEYETRLRSAILTAETEARRSIEHDIQRAAHDAGETARREVMIALEAQIRRQIEEARKEARERAQADMEAINRRTDSASTAEIESLVKERDRLASQLAEWRLLAGAEVRLTEADSQMEMLVRFLKLASGFGESIAVYIAKADGLALWKSRGEGVYPPTISQETAATDMYFRPIIARGKPVAAIAAAPVFRRDALDFLTTCLERSIALLGLKLQNPAAVPAPPAKAIEAHEEAREAARALVTEIATTREMDLIEGRVNSDIYQRLHDDIETARRLYQERVPCGIAVSRDYFDEELVKALTENHPSLMGAGYPGPID